MGAAGRGRAAPLVRHRPRQRRGRHGAAVRHDRPRLGPGDRQQPLPVDRARAPAPRDRLDLGRDGVPADRRQPRGQAAPADPRVRDARRQPGRVQDPRAERALARRRLPGIGATFEGVFRHHMIMPDGSLRDSAYFSVLADEWPAVKAQLQASLAAGGTDAASGSASARDRLAGRHRASGDGRRHLRGQIAHQTEGSVRGFIVGTAITAIAFYVLTTFLPQFVELRRRARRADRPGGHLRRRQRPHRADRQDAGDPDQPDDDGTRRVPGQRRAVAAHRPDRRLAGFNLTVGDFPPDLLTADTIVAAVIGSSS